MKNARISIIIAMAALAVGCREIQNPFGGSDIIASVGKEDLLLKEVEPIMPKDLNAEDSSAFVEMYVDKWVLKQLKLREAEEVFSSSEADIEALVDEYRQSLLIRKLDQYYVDKKIDTAFTDNDLQRYYQSHLAEFKLGEPVLRGVIVRFPNSYRRASKLKDMLSGLNADKMQFVKDVCDKNGLELVDYSSDWVDINEFLANLPIRHTEQSEKFLQSGVVQEAKDNDSRYYFVVTDFRVAGDSQPMSMVIPTIKQIIFTDRQNEIIKKREKEMLKSAKSDGIVKIYNDDTKK